MKAEFFIPLAIDRLLYDIKYYINFNLNFQNRVNKSDF